MVVAQADAEVVGGEGSRGESQPAAGREQVVGATTEPLPVGRTRGGPSWAACCELWDIEPVAARLQ